MKTWIENDSCQGTRNAEAGPLTEPDKTTDELARAVIGAAIEVHRHLGPGFLESVYEEALGVELADRRIPFERQKEISLLYKDREIGKHRIDLLVGKLLIVELKTVDALADLHQAQVISYLKASRLPVGLLINFNVSVLKKGDSKDSIYQPSNRHDAKHARKKNNLIKNE